MSWTLQSLCPWTGQSWTSRPWTLSRPISSTGYMHLRCFFLIGQTLSIIFDMKVADPSRESCLNNISWHLTTSAFVFQLLISEGVELVLTGGGLERRNASHLLFLMSRSHGSSDALRVTSKRNIIINKI